MNQLHNHPTADAIYAFIAAQHPTISKATVYRNLNQLAAQGEIFARACADRCRSL